MFISWRISDLLFPVAVSLGRVGVALSTLGIAFILNAYVPVLANDVRSESSPMHTGSVTIPIAPLALPRAPTGPRAGASAVREFQINAQRLRAGSSQTRPETASSQDSQSRVVQFQIELNHSTIAGDSIIYQYDARVHRVVCAVQKICDIQLQAGERISNFLVGNPDGWDINKAHSGRRSNKQPHLLLSPLHVDQNTSLVVTTDRRVYHFDLEATSNNYVASVSFDYSNYPRPEPVRSSVDDVMAQAFSDNTLIGQFDDFDFHYQLSGDTPDWKPTRVFNDGARTYIQLPMPLTHGTSPMLLVRDDFGNRELISYRLRGQHYVVDTVFTQAVLVDLRGNNATVTIDRVLQ